jgi:hypothetical protein
MNSVDTDERIAELVTELQWCREQSQTLSEMNSLFLSRFINKRLRLPTTFVDARRALPELAPHVHFLWSIANEIVKAGCYAAQLLEDAGVPVTPGLFKSSQRGLFWFCCDNCSRRLPLTWGGPGSRAATAFCPQCEMYCKVRSTDVGSLAASGKLIPRVLADDLLDTFAWNHRAGFSYRGGLEHYVFAAIVAHRLQLSPLPEFLSHVNPDGGLPDLLCPEYANFVDQLARCGDGAAVRARDLTLAGRGSLVQLLLWGRRDLATSSPRFIAEDALAYPDEGTDRNGESVGWSSNGRDQRRGDDQPSSS